MPDAVYEYRNGKRIAVILNIETKNAFQSAQRHGLFSTKDALPLDDQFFDQIPDLEAKWKAWGKIECAKR
jgi:hypothetical protein